MLHSKSLPRVIVPVSEDFNWAHFFEQMTGWDVSLIRFEQGVNIPANQSTKTS